MQKDEGRWRHAWNSSRLSEAGGTHLAEALDELGRQPRQPHVDEMLRNSLVLRLPGPANFGILPAEVPGVLDLRLDCREIVAGRADLRTLSGAASH